VQIFRIDGKKQSYCFFPENKESILRSKGGFSTIYQGIRLPEKTKVIIKQLNLVYKDDHTEIERFKKEAEMNIEHPRLVKTLDYIQFEDKYFIVRQFIHGIDTKALRKQNAIPKSKRLNFWIECAIQTAEGLDYLHKQNIIHCDIKPSNILIEFQANGNTVNFETPSCKIIDLGLSKTVYSYNNQLDIKIPFALIYSPPEQILNRTELVNESSDIYSLAITLYELLTGEPAFQNTHPAKLINIQLNSPLVRSMRIPKPIFEILLKATSKHKFLKPPQYYKTAEIEEMLKAAQQKRYQTANEFINALREAQKVVNEKKSLFSFFKKK